MKVAGNIATDTVKATRLIKNNGAAGEVLLANGSVVPSNTTAGMILTSNANGTPTWEAAPVAGPTGGPSFTQAATAGLGGTQNGLGLGTSTPNSLFTIDGSGYPAKKIFNITSNNNVSGVLNSVNNAFLGLNFFRNNLEQWYMGLYPVATTAHHLIIKGSDYTDDNTPTSGRKMGINRNDPNFTVDVEGSVRAKGYRYNIRKIFPASGVATTINLDWSDDYILIYPTGSNLSNITVNFNTLPEYNAGYASYSPTNPDVTYYDGRKLNYTSKRIVVKVIGNGTVTNNNFIKFDFAISNITSLYNDGYNREGSQRTIDATYNQTYVFVFSRKQHDSILWCLENSATL
jgi:hypothetical protein